jgi:hypothetical protein
VTGCACCSECAARRRSPHIWTRRQRTWKSPGDNEQVPGGEYNFDFVRQSATAPTIEITSPNLGTLGSSDGSVVVPFPGSLT